MPDEAQTSAGGNRRAWAMAAVLAAVVVASLAAVGLFAGGDEPASPPHEPLISGAIVGVSPQTTLDSRDYDKIEEADVGIIRAPMNWSRVQAEPGDCEPEFGGVCNWADLDATIGNAAVAGARVLPILSDLPAYISKHHTKPPLNGEARAGWEDFIDAVVRRYGTGGVFWKNEFTRYPYGGEPQPIVEWQVWNEPNGKVYFYPHPNARKYAYLLDITANAIRNVNPEAEIVLAGMFGTAEISQPKFLRDLYKVPGVKSDFDAYALHPYSRGLHELKLQVSWARREARKAGDEDAGLWITELGWGSGTGDHPLEKGDEGQADLLLKSFQLFGRKREAWNVEGVIWFTWQDRLDGEVCKFCRHAGLFSGNDHSKASYTAFKQATGGD